MSEKVWRKEILREEGGFERKRMKKKNQRADRKTPGGEGVAGS